MSQERVPITASVKNPLGIIALFISLIYLIASAVLAASTLSTTERMVLVYFIALFPVLVLLLFVWMVVKHHTKLFGPSDYRADDHFLRSIDPELRHAKLEREVREAEAPGEIEDRASPVTESAQPISTDVKPRRPPLREIARRYHLAEELALNAIQEELGLPIRRAVTVGSEGWPGYDGVVTAGDELIVVETRLLRRSFATRLAETLDRARRTTREARDSGKAKSVRMILAWVLDMPKGQQGRVRNLIPQSLKNAPLEAGLIVENRFFDFEDLREQFGSAQD